MRRIRGAGCVQPWRSVRLAAARTTAGPGISRLPRAHQAQAARWVAASARYSTDAPERPRVAGLDNENVFATFTALANQCGAINLGQGFPTFPPPQFLLDAACEAIMGGHNQYTRPGGHPELVKTLAAHYSPRLGRSLDPMSEIVTCNGAQEGIFVAVTTFCEEGDEIVCIEPYFDAYRKAAQVVGATCRGVPLRYAGGGSAQPERAAELTLDLAELESHLSERSRLLILNTPHNPSGKVFSREELDGIADVVQRYPRLLVISDEVYEHMVFDGLEHVRFASLKNGEMFERTMTVFSAGKTFSCTGWRVGYFVAPSRLALPLIKAQSVVAFASATPLELAVASAMTRAEQEGYFDSFPAMLQAKRDRMVAALRAVGLKPIVPQGGYFTMIDSSEMTLEDCATMEWTEETPLPERRDYQLAVQLSKTIGITAIPPSPFYSPHNRHLADNMLRLAYCKRDEEIDAVAVALRDAHAAGLLL